MTKRTNRRCWVTNKQTEGVGRQINKQKVLGDKQTNRICWETNKQTEGVGRQNKQKVLGDQKQKV